MKRNFLIGSFLLIISNLIAKLLGAFYRIPLSNMIGAEGIGIYQMIFPIYALLLVLSSSGFPIAISKLISSSRAQGNTKKIKKIFLASFILLFGFGLVFSVLILIFAKQIALLQGNVLATSGYLVIAPALLLSCLVACFRGYFQGYENMAPTAISNIIEQTFKLVVGLFLAYTLLPKGIEYGVMGAIIGVTIGELITLIFLTILYLIKRKKYIKEEFIKKENNNLVLLNPVVLDTNDNLKNIFKEVIKIAIPITLGSIIIPFITFIESFIIVNLLMYKGYSNSSATTLFGLFTGMVTPLINFPTIFSLSIGTAIIPAISFKLEKKDTDLNSKINFALKIVFLLAFPSFIGMLIFAPQIINLFFLNGHGAVNGDEIMIASYLLEISAINVFYLCFFQICTSILQGFGKYYKPVKNLLIFGIIKLILMVLLMLFTNLNIYAVAISNCVAYCVATILIIKDLNKITKINIDFKCVLKMFVSSCIMAVLGLSINGLLEKLMGANLAFLLSVIISVGIYILMLFLLKTLTKDEVKEFPLLNNLVKD